MQRNLGARKLGSAKWSADNECIYSSDFVELRGAAGQGKPPTKTFPLLLGLGDRPEWLRQQPRIGEQEAFGDGRKE